MPIDCADGMEKIRDELAGILETIADEGLPGSRDLDVALDAITESMRLYARDAMLRCAAIADERAAECAQRLENCEGYANRVGLLAERKCAGEIAAAIRLSTP